MSRERDRTTRYQEGSLSLPGTVMLGTGVMIGVAVLAMAVIAIAKQIFLKGSARNRKATDDLSHAHHH